MKSCFSVALFVFMSAVGSFAADRPTENQGANAVAAKIKEESNGLLRLEKFTRPILSWA